MYPKFLQPLLIAVAILSFLPSHASERFFEYYFTNPGNVGPQVESQLALLEKEFGERDFMKASSRMDAIIAALDLETLDVRTLAKLKSNDAILKAATNNPTEAILALEDAITLLEDAFGPYDKTHNQILTLKGTIHAHYNEYDNAENAYRRAQHISHRHGGVYTLDQLPIVDLLSELNISRGQYEDADREVRFYLKISELTYGEESVELLPVLDRVGSYLAERGEMISRPKEVSLSPMFVNGLVIYEEPTELKQLREYRDRTFRESIECFERALKIIEDNYGSNDLKLVDPLRGLADAKLKQRLSPGRAEAAMERMLQVVESNASTDVADHARALVELADVYTQTSDDRAEAAYLEAWNLLDGKPDFAKLKNELFGRTHRLYPVSPYLITIDRLPQAAEGDANTVLYADMEFSVGTDGRVTDIRTIDHNVPNSEVGYLRRHMRLNRYRPRIEDGKLVETDGLMLHQVFQFVPPDQTGRSTSFTIQTN